MSLRFQLHSTVWGCLAAPMQQLQLESICTLIHEISFSSVWLCVTIGWALSQHDVKFLYRFAVMLILLGFVVHMAEAYFLWKYRQVDPTKHDYLIGTIFFATGVALLSLRKTKNDTETIFSRFGRFTLGIYGGTMFLSICLNRWGIICRLAFGKSCFP